ncbi:MAG: acetyltransferase [Actinomycetota bacterium]
MASEVPLGSTPEPPQSSNVSCPESGVPLVVLGGGGHAIDVLHLVLARWAADGRGAASVIVADDDSEALDRFKGIEVETVSPLVDAFEPGRLFISGVGYPEPRRLLVRSAANADMKPLDAVVHPSAVIHPDVVIGVGSVISGLTWISPAVTCGQHAYIGYGAKIGHDVSIGHHSSIMPGAFVGGETVIGDGVLIGANATVLQGLEIGAGARVGAGSVVTRSVAVGATVVGSPAREMS